jgi:hypothetical protein
MQPAGEFESSHPAAYRKNVPQYAEQIEYGD